MHRVLILAEGPTEERFIQDVLAPHLQSLIIYATPIVLETKRTLSGKKYKGGVSVYYKIRADVLRLLQNNDAIVTTMLDMYGLPKDFPGLGQTIGNLKAQDKVKLVQAAFATDINDPRFFPFIALHEFEALVLASPQSLGAHFNNSALTPWCQKMTDQAGGPELVNDGATTAPSKRLQSKIDGYGKVINGPAIVAKEGLATVRSRCPHFNNWVIWLESLAPEAVI